MKPPNTKEDAQRLLEIPHCETQEVITEPIMLFLDIDNSCMEVVKQSCGTYAKREFKGW